MAELLYIENTNVIELNDLTNNLTGNKVTNAAVQVTLKTKGTAPANVPGQTWPVTLDHVADGLYRAILSHALQLDKGKTYEAHVEADAGVDLKAKWITPVTAKVRQ